ncbi:MAG TPA: NADH-quinone oxidoreductase subunit J [Pirellulales bacterium]|nr:NADH-quinone oxidoreductase subunit J [Pirellulales bacterium]
MNQTLGLIAAATLLFAVGMWLMLPRGVAAGRSLGAVFTAAGLGLFASRLPVVGNWAAESVFFILASITVLAAVATVTFRKPVYSAIWFSLSLLGTAGLFLFDGAQFLGVATIVVYAGAILVTFLFVLMLAQPEGQAGYDRLSWGAAFSASGGALMVGTLTMTLAAMYENPQIAHLPAPLAIDQLRDEILADEHVAHLGAQLFSTYLVPVEVGGTLLLVALVGAVAIVAQIRKPSLEKG